MADTEMETCLGDVIENAVTKDITCKKVLKRIEKLGEKRNKENWESTVGQ